MGNISSAFLKHDQIAQWRQFLIAPVCNCSRLCVFAQFLELQIAICSVGGTGVEWLVLSPHSNKDLGSNPQLSQVPFCVELACSPGTPASSMQLGLEG